MHIILKWRLKMENRRGATDKHILDLNVNEPLARCLWMRRMRWMEAFDSLSLSQNVLFFLGVEVSCIQWQWCAGFYTGTQIPSGRASKHIRKMFFPLKMCSWFSLLIAVIRPASSSVNWSIYNCVVDVFRKSFLENLGCPIHMFAADPSFHCARRPNIYSA